MGPYLLQDKDNCPCFLDFDNKLPLEVASEPSDVDTSPFLRDAPAVVEEAGAIQVGKGTKHVGVGHPKDTVILEAVVELRKLRSGISYSLPATAQGRSECLPNKESTPSTHHSRDRSTLPSRLHRARPRGSYHGQNASSP
jgi:hypothetical protein